MSLTFTITPNGEAAISYAGITTAHATTRQAIDFDAGAALQQQYRFHAPGVAGQWLIRDAQTARDIRVVVRYMADTLANAEAAYQADAAKFVTKQVEIGCMGQTYKGCNVKPESMKRSSPIKPVGRATATAVFFNVSMSFTQDNPEGL